MANKQYIIQFLEDEHINQMWFCSHNPQDAFWKLIGFMGYLTREDEVAMCEFSSHPSHDHNVLTVDEVRDYYNNLFGIDLHATTWGTLFISLLGYWEAVTSGATWLTAQTLKRAKLRKNRIILRVEEFGEEFTGIWQNPNYTAIIERFTRKWEN